MLRHVVRAVCFVIALNAAPALAQDVKITEAMVHEFYKTVNDSYKLPYAEYLTQLKEGMRSDFRSIISFTISGPGIPPTADRQVMDYQTLLGHAEASYESMKGATIKTSLSNIRIAADGQSVALTETTRISRMKMMLMKGENYMDTDGVCEDELALSADGKLQVFKSVCTGTGMITKMQEL